MAKRKKITKEQLQKEPEKSETNFKQVISTGSTLLDLAISGTATREGGVPGGIIFEIFGPHGGGKTAILGEMAASAQLNNGEANFKDPEGRLDREYSRIYGMDLKEKDYSRPDTVNQTFDELRTYQPKNDEAINISCIDSLAALSTEIEMEDKDKMGMKRAKDFSEQLRKTCRLIANNNWLVACSNQEREGTGGGLTTPGGKGIPYYASLRMRIAPNFKGAKITKKKKIREVEHEKIIGINSLCTIAKSSIDAPYRKAQVYIVFGYGVHNIWGNLQYLKDIKYSDKYFAVDEEFGRIETAIKHIENNSLEEDLRQIVIAQWHEINDAFKIERKKKKRR